MVDVNPGSRIKQFVDSDNRDVEAVVGNMGDTVLDVPENPGPAVTGRTPVLGQFRRNKNLPVVRDEVASFLD